MNYLEKIMLNSDIICIQETHAEEETAEHCLRNCRREHNMYHATHPQPGTGGMMIAVKRSYINGGTAEAKVIVPGRAMKLTIKKANTKITVWNIHNFGLERSEAEAIEKGINEDEENARGNPKCVHLVVAGDLNFSPIDAKVCDYSRPTPCTAPARQLTRQDQVIARAIGRLLENRPRQSDALPCSDTHSKTNRPHLREPPILENNINRDNCEHIGRAKNTCEEKAI